MTYREALRVAATIADQASGRPMDRLLLADAMDLSPSSSVFRAVLSNSRQYGLTEGTEKAEKVSLTDLGERGTSDDPDVALSAGREAAIGPEPFRRFFDEFSNRKFPATTFLEKWLQEMAGVPAMHSLDAVRVLTQNARDLGLIRPIKGSEYVIRGEGSAFPAPAADIPEVLDGADLISELEASPPREVPAPRATGPDRSNAGKVFIGHGKNRVPLEQLKGMLKMLGVEIGVAIDEAHGGRPISQKVAEVMQSCTSACFVLTADERYTDAEGREQWRPSDNAVYELGAASILYGKRIVIFRERDVSFASDFSDLGYITFEKDRLDATMAELLKELVAFGIVEIRAAR